MEIVALIFAHVKWFAPFDVHAMPKPIGEVLNGTFVKFFLASVAGITIFFWADRTAYRRGFLSALDARLKRLDEFSIHILRFSAAVVWRLSRVKGLRGWQSSLPRRHSRERKGYLTLSDGG